MTNQRGMVLSVKKSAIQLNILPLIPSFLSLIKSPFLQTMSNAFSKSTRLPT